MSEYRQAVKRLPKDERIVVAHLEELIGNLKAVRVATVFKGQEALIAAEIEKEVMAHLMTDLKAEIQKERSKIESQIAVFNEYIVRYNKVHADLQKQMDQFTTYLEILGHMKALSTEGKVKLFLPTEDELSGIMVKKGK